MSLKYRPEIDGLRAVAVVPVILYHAGASAFSGGYVGVDVFFVISGYLIASILVSDLETDRFSIWRFYERRIRRILPALFVVLLFCWGGAWFWMTPGQGIDTARTIVAAVAFASNIYFWLVADYFAPDTALNPMLHTWSLAVEEQFYLVFPAFLWLVWKRGGLRWAWRATVIVSAISLACAVWASQALPVANFYLMPSRAWELGAGALCGYMLGKRTLPGRDGPALLGVAMILGAVVGFNSGTPFPSLYALLPVVGTVLVILYGSGETLVGRVLSLRPFVAIGLVSYSAYLWHQPLMAFARVRDAANSPAFSTMLALAALSFVLAALTWRFVEQPFRRRGSPWLKQRRSVFLAGAAGSVVLLALAGWTMATGGHRAAWEARHPDAVQTLRVIENAKASRTHAVEQTPCRFRAGDPNERFWERVRKCSETQGPVVLVVGDSHAIGLFNGMVQNDVFADRPLIGLTHSKCRIHEKDSDCFDRLRRFVSANPEVISGILYDQAGFHLLETREGWRGREILSGHPMSQRLEPGSFRPIDSRVAEVTAGLDELSRSVPVIWIGPKIEPQLPEPVLLQVGCDGRFALRPGQRQIFEELDHAIAARSAGARYRYVSQVELTRFDMRRDFMSCKGWLWVDGDHWSPAGSARFVRRLERGGAFRFRGAPRP